MTTNYRLPTTDFPWAILLLLTATLRLAGLGTAPLSADEATQALAALRAVRPDVFPLERVSVPPLLFHLNAFLFALFDGGDGLARLVPALCGIGLVLTPRLLQRYLGCWGALGSGLMLALSPTVLAYSRILDGAVPAAFGVMLLVGAFARYLDSWRPVWLALGGLGLALALTAGPTAWGLLIGLILALAAGLYVWRDQVALYWPIIRPALSRGLIACGLGLFVFGAGLGFHPAGLAAAGEQFLRWLRVNSSAISSVPLALASEPLILLAGLVGAALALGRRHGMGLLWTFWAVTGAAQWLLGFGQGYEQGQALSLLVPLAGLGGIAVEEMARALQGRGRGVGGGLYIAISLVLWAYTVLLLARYSRYGQWAELALVGISLAFQAVLVLFFGLTISVPREGETPEEATRRAFSTALSTAGVSLLMVLVAVTFGIGWRGGHFCSTDPACALTPNPTAPDVRLLVEQIRWVGARHGLLRPSVALMGTPDPALVWALREFDLRVVGPDAVTGDDRPLIVVAPADVPVPSGYAGSAFTLRRSWVRPQLPHQWVRWWFYREPPVPSQPADQVVLWVSQPSNDQ